MEDDEKTCPACAETIKAAARKCKHCGEILDGTAAVPAAPIAVQVVSTPETPQSGGEALGRVGMGVGSTMFLYGLYNQIAVSDTKHAMGEYGDAGMFARMAENATFYMVVGGIVALISLFIMAASQQSATGSQGSASRPLVASDAGSDHLPPWVGRVVLGVALAFVVFIFLLFNNYL